MTEILQSVAIRLKADSRAGRTPQTQAVSSAPASGTMVPSASRAMVSLSTRCGSPLSFCIQGPSQNPRTCDKPHS